VTRILRIVRLALVGAILLVLAVGGGEVPAAHADTYAPLSGSGSTWSQNALDQWRTNVYNNYGMTVNYSGTGSSAGRRDFINNTVDFAVSEIPFQAAPQDGSAAEAPTTGYAYMPIVAGGTAFMYNLKIGGKRVSNLRLSGETITKIFTGAITNWNDVAIKADNPGLAMPDKAIVPVVRSDGSGSTAQFTLWMSKQFSSIWNAFCGCTGLTSQYPTFANAKAQNGSLGVAGYVAQGYGEGAITYVEYSYALKQGFPVAKVLNSAGYYVEPTASSVAVALLQAQINNDSGSPDYLTQILDGVYNSSDSRSYPLSSYSYMIIPTQVAGVFNTDKGHTLGAFARYMLCEGQQQASALGYSPLPLNLVLAGSDQIKRIPGAGNTGVDTGACNNPTFKAGDSPGNNLLAQTAPSPADCDKQGPNQCVTRTGGADEDTAVSGSGDGGSSNDAAASGNGAGTSSVSNTAGTGGTPVYDENGALVSGSNGGGGGSAVAKPFTYPDPGVGPGQLIMLGAGLLLVASVVLPPTLFRRLKAGKR
jgi:phosphate transport system substrate-binding protein